jgi:hypothetical protein
MHHYARNRGASVPWVGPECTSLPSRLTPNPTTTSVLALAHRDLHQTLWFCAARRPRERAGPSPSTRAAQQTPAAIAMAVKVILIYPVYFISDYV